MVHFLVILSLLGFLENQSVATAGGASSAFLNPAGFSTMNSLEGYGFLWYADNETTYIVSLSLVNTGLAFRSSNGHLQYEVSSSFRIKKEVNLGLSCTFGDIKEFRLGTLIRPWRFLSLGAAVNFPQDGESHYRAGLGLRPFGEILTVYGDLMAEKDSVAGYLCGVSVEPLKGLVLHATYDDEGSITAGFELRLGHSRASLNASGNGIETCIAASRREYPSLPFFKRATVLTLDLSGNIHEEKSIDIFRRPKGWCFAELVEALKRARNDKNINGILIKLRAPSIGFAQCEELRNLLKELRRNGKKIFVFAEMLSFRDYYLASVADMIITTPDAWLAIPGISLTKLYFKGTMEKLGIEAEVARVGEFKSAVEPFLRKKMSKEDREQLDRLLEVMFNEAKAALSERPGLDAEKIDEILDLAYLNPDEALERGLIDTTAYDVDLKNILKEKFGKKVKFVDLWKYYRAKPVDLAWADKPKIAVLTAEGGIVVGEGEVNPLFGGKSIGSDAMVRALEKLEKDKSVKAVVIRIDSPGGSAIASNIIAGSVRKLRRKKPVVISMGNVAASGGYYISCPATEIVADKTTVTGSIGILAMKFVMKSFYEKLGLSSDVVKIGEHADCFSTWRNFTDEERQRFKKEIEDGYWRFVRTVARGRNMTEAQVDSIARGRVWAGLDAKELGLVDKIGGLEDAIERAKELAGLKDKDVEIDIVPLRRPKFPFLRNSEVLSVMPVLSLLREKFLYLMPPIYFTDN